MASTYQGLPGLIIAVVALVLSQCFFVLASVAITRSRASRLREMCRDGSRSAALARTIVLHPERYHLSTQLGLFLSPFLTGFCVFWLFHSQLVIVKGLETPLGGELAHGLFGLAGFVLFTLCVCVLIVLARGIGVSFPEKVLCVLARSIAVCPALFAPFVYALKFLTARIFPHLGLRLPLAREEAVSPEELHEIVELSTEAGKIEEEEKEMIKNVFSFSDTVVREIMTPRKDIIAVSAAASLREICTLFTREQMSRILVYGHDLDDVRGVLHSKDLIRFIGQPSMDFDLNALLRRPYFASGGMQIDDLLQELRKQAVHLAVVQDEHGGVDGLVTLEDLVEELVGDICDEYDIPAEEIESQKTAGGDLLVDGSMLIDDLNDKHKLELSNGEYDTLAGFVISLFGRIPEMGESIEYNGLRIKVEEADQNRVTLVRIRRLKHGHHHLSQ